ncbi:MAG TPA: ABC transporter ATP-binding protein [Polyangiaceae bacterium]|nr:ABC transporter ATP-binding protein [Polyangiaceae bacterium]
MKTGGVSILRSLDLFRIAWRKDPRRLALSVPLMLLQSSALPVSAVALGWLTDAASAGDVRAAAWAGAAVAALVIASLTAGHFAHIFYFELSDLILVELQGDLIEVSNGSPGIEHHERAEYVVRLQIVREDLARGGANVLNALLGSIGLAVGMAVTGVLLWRLQPWLLVLPLAAVPPLVAGRRAEALLARGREQASSCTRLARHLFALATDPARAKELRTCGLGPELRARQAASWAEASRIMWSREVGAAALRVAGQLAFALAYVGATLLVIREAIAGHGSAGDVIVAITLAAQVNQQVSTAVSLHDELQRVAKTLTDLSWIRGLVTRPPRDGGSASAVMPPAALSSGIRFEDVAFSYPGGSSGVLEGVNLTLSAGSTVAIVGENGVGKSTLVKLLCGFYEPSSGSIQIDGTDSKRLALGAWRERIAAGFQDFVRFELVARESIGVGHLPDADSEQAVVGALRRARSDDLLPRLERGLATLLGKSFPAGHELSGGQWQKVALGRAMMRQNPLLLVLDEPTSALDARAEHELFEQYAESAKRVARGTGAITLLVSHRFSTVAMADQILVMAGKGVAEAGTHRELMARRGLYAELYSLQAAAYQ